jgi:hypothetical protein
MEKLVYAINGLKNELIIRDYWDDKLEDSFNYWLEREKIRLKLAYTTGRIDGQSEDFPMGEENYIQQAYENN